MGYKNIEDRRAYHRQYQKERRQWYKEHHYCTECGKQDARTLIGKRYCFDCLEKRTGKPCNASDFCKTFHISLTTLRKWEIGEKEMPQKWIDRGFKYVDE